MTSTAGPAGPYSRTAAGAAPRRGWRVAWALRWLLAGLALVGWALPSQAQEDPPGRVGRVASVEGDVRWRDPQSGQWVPIERNQPVTGGDRVQVATGARAQLEVGSSTWLLDGGSELEVLRLDDAAMRIELHGGSLGLVLRADEAVRETEVVTIAGRFLPQLRGRYRIDDTGDAAIATAWSGRLRFEAGGSGRAVTMVEPGQRAEFWIDGGAREQGAAPVADAFADWIAAVDRASAESASARYVSPEMTGYQDLDRHGHWETTVEYGALWTPTVVEAGWAPYRDGRWVWVAPWGWTWVDRAPWGYAPFHYGRWVRWRDRWCWTPGGYVRRPVWAPALVGWVGSPGLSVQIGVGSPPPLGWVPLAPREVYRPWYPVGWQHWRAVNEYRHDRDDAWREWRRHPRGDSPDGWARGHDHYVNGRLPGAVTLSPVGVDWRRRDPLHPVVLPGLRDGRGDRRLADDDRRDGDRDRGVDRGRDDRWTGRDDRDGRQSLIGRDGRDGRDAAEPRDGRNPREGHDSRDGRDGWTGTAPGREPRVGIRPDDDGRPDPAPGAGRERTPRDRNGDHGSRDGRDGRGDDRPDGIGRVPSAVDRDPRRDAASPVPGRVTIDDGRVIGNGSGRAPTLRDDADRRPDGRWDGRNDIGSGIGNGARDRGHRDLDARPLPRPVMPTPAPRGNDPRNDSRNDSRSNGRIPSQWRDDGVSRWPSGGLAPGAGARAPSHEPSGARADGPSARRGGDARLSPPAAHRTADRFGGHEARAISGGGGGTRAGDPRVVGRQAGHDRRGGDRHGSN